MKRSFTFLVLAFTTYSGALVNLTLIEDLPEDPSSGDDTLDTTSSQDYFSGDSVAPEPSWQAEGGNVGSGEGPTSTYRIVPSGIEKSICFTEFCREDSAGDSPMHVVTVGVVGGSKVVEGSNVTLECTIHLMANATAAISWYLPHRVSGQDISSDRVDIEYTEDLIQGSKWLRGPARVLRSELHVTNVSVTDAGVYTCLVLVTSHCCQNNVSLTMNVHRPLSYGFDVVIIATVCFVELVVILYVKTRDQSPGDDGKGRRRHNNVSYEIVNSDPEDLKRVV